MLDEKDLQAIAQLMEKQKQDIMSESEIEELRNEVSVLKLAIRTMNQEIAELKKAQ